MELEGQVVVITGGSGGIGWASAKEWLARGGKVVIADIRDDVGQRLAADYSGKVVFVHCDTRRKQDLEAAAAAAAPLGEITCWFNNAGFGLSGDDASALKRSGYSQDLRNMVEVNLSAYIEGVGVALRFFSEKRGGVIVSTASMAGLLPLGAPPVYSATKAAVVHFTRALGLTLGEQANVRVYCLCPSYTATAGGPSAEAIQGALGGVLRASHMGEGFAMLVTRRPPNGSVMRVTVRERGAKVVHDLVVYGRELGGAERPREGIVLKEAPLEPVSAEEAAQLNEVSDSGRDHAGKVPSRL